MYIILEKFLQSSKDLIFKQNFWKIEGIFQRGRTQRDPSV
jgi:hypothetical protein